MMHVGRHQLKFDVIVVNECFEKVRCFIVELLVDLRSEATIFEIGDQLCVGSQNFGYYSVLMGSVRIAFES